MSARRLILVALIAGLGPMGRLASADFDLLTADTYLSPLVVASAREARAAAPPTFLWSSLTAAVESRYLSRNDAAKTASAVGVVTGNYYFDKWQLGGVLEHRTKLDGTGDPDESVVPRERARVYAGYYVPLHRSVTRARFGGNDFRVLGGLSSDRRRDGRWVDGAFVEVAVKLMPERIIARKTFLKDLTGGYLYAWRDQGNEHFIGYSARATIRREKHGVNLRYVLSAGIERKFGNSHWGQLQNGLLLWYDDSRTKLHYELGLSISRDMYRDEWNDQIMFAIKRDLMARIIRR